MQSSAKVGSKWMRERKRCNREGTKVDDIDRKGEERERATVSRGTPNTKKDRHSEESM